MLLYHSLMLSFDVSFGVIFWCYHFSQFANVIIVVLSFFLVQDGCYHLCYHLMLSFFVIISPLFSFSWKRDTRSVCKTVSKHILASINIVLRVLAGVAQEGSPVGVGIDEAVVGGVVYIRSAYVAQAAATTTVGSHDLCPRLMLVLKIKRKAALQRKSNFCIPRKGIAPASQSQFSHLWVCERFIYSQVCTP
jgi:hypothetical protein